MADSRHITRRSALKAMPAAGASLILPTVALAAKGEPYEKVRRLVDELSEALVDTPRYEYVMVRPANDYMPYLIALEGASSAETMASLYLSEYRRKMSEIDPLIKRWAISRAIDDEDVTRLAIAGFTR